MIAEEGKVWTWGSGGARLGTECIETSVPHVVSDLPRIVDVACGKNFSLALAGIGSHVLLYWPVLT